MGSIGSGGRGGERRPVRRRSHGLPREYGSRNDVRIDDDDVEEGHALLTQSSAHDVDPMRQPRTHRWPRRITFSNKSWPLFALVAFILFTQFNLYRYLRHNIKHHKLVNEGQATFISAALTLLAICVIAFVVALARLLFLAAKRHIVTARGINKRRLIFATVAILTPFLSFLSYISAREHARCGSKRILSIDSGERVVLCADGCVVAYHVLFTHLLYQATRFLGDTFLYHDGQHISHLHWKTVLDAPQCQNELLERTIVTQRGRASLNETCNYERYERYDKVMEEEQQPTERDDSLMLPPFRISNELQIPDALHQIDLVTNQLGGCRIDQVSRISLEFSPSSSPPSADSPPSTLEFRKEKRGNENGNGGKTTAIVLSASNFGEHNFYHVSHMDGAFHCLYLALLQNAPMSTTTTLYAQPELTVILPTEWKSPIGLAIARALANSFGVRVEVLSPTEANPSNDTSTHPPNAKAVTYTYNALLHVHMPYDGKFGVVDMLRSGSLGSPWPLWDTIKFESYRLPNPFGVLFSEAVRRGNENRVKLMKEGDDLPPPSPSPHVLVVQRRGSRRLVGSRTGGFDEILDALCARGVPVETAEFESLSAEEQIDRVSRATVLVGAHGAGLGNAAWMEPGSVLVEVLMRQGFGGEDYHKADFANLSRFYGLKYVYYDALGIEPKDSDGIDARNVVVDAEELARVVSCLFREAESVNV